MADISIMGWRQDVGAKGQDYAMTGTMLWIGVMAGEPFVSVTQGIIELMNRPLSLFAVSPLPRCCRVPWSLGLLCVAVHSFTKARTMDSA